ncbi:MFS general substrate transporter [Hortaea werneckii]|nr:MFS general substrate transporter [Hortaea werneckii]KAI6991229.1 MFS general substrate transporter [Hortaea werneckii]KAI7144224.1 MFS general substrate transporter [Hortaea werneckii]KAI7172105.1 MFS general substrate transporter [Hortaea werneckii]KAI7507477.1 MFS general substrate transporter [Hortaea werneckii]
MAGEGSSSFYGTFSAQHESNPDFTGAGSNGFAEERSIAGHEKRNTDNMIPFDDRDHDEDDFDAESHASTQPGVKRVEAIATTWTKASLYVAYLGIALLACSTSLESQTTTNLTIYATSAFSAHSLVSTVLVVQGVVLSVVKPPMSKIADVFGRFEAFSLSVFIYVIGYVQQAAANNVKTYAAAQIFYSAGQTGLQILVQIFIADTSDLLNRALIVTLPDIPFLVNVWIGPPLANTILQRLSWRWGYGIWAIVLPVAFCPLALVLYLNQVKAERRGLLPPSLFQGQSKWKTIKSVWFELDAFGLLLICFGFSLILIPLTIGKKTSWNDPTLIAMLVVGAVCVIGFPFWERSKTLAPKAFFPKGLAKNKTVVAGLAFAFFYFMAFYLSVYPYFQSYLLVVKGLDVAQAGHIIQIFTFAATVTSILVSLLIKYTGRYRQFVTIGACVYVAGLVLMVFFRTQESSIGAIIGAQILIGIGGGICHGPAQLGVQASASHQEVAAATAAFLTLLEIGGAFGSAISGAIWSGNVLDKLKLYLPEETKARAEDIYGNIGLAANGWPMGDPTREAINRAYQETMTMILMVAVCVAIPCIFLSLLMKDYKLDEIDQHVKGVVIGSAQDNTDHQAEAGPSNSSSTRLLARPSHEFDEETTLDFSSQGRRAASLLGKQKNRRA